MAKQICCRCIMDNINDPDLYFNSNGVCNHCQKFESELEKIERIGDKKIYLDKLFEEIRNSAGNKQYDCIIGISGGVDSSYLCYVAKQNNLRPLLVHFDNGWNTEIAVNNITKIVKSTGFDLYTWVIDWEEMRDLQLAFFKAHVVDLELPYDYALITASYKVAEKHNIKYVLTGHNLVTEGTYLPKSWRHDKTDIVNIRSIHKLFGQVRWKTYPWYGFIKQRLVFNRLKVIYPLDFMDYSAKQARETIIKELGWVSYGGKHGENIFTRFYQGYILKEKFGIDKTQFHLSVQVQSGRITREEALKLYESSSYAPELLNNDREFVLKKLGLTEQEFTTYLNTPRKEHSDYPTIKRYWDVYFKLVKMAKPILKPLRHLKRG